MDELDSLQQAPEQGHTPQPMATGATATLLSQVTTLALAFLTGIMTARALGAAGKGSVAIMLQAPAMAAVLLGLGVNTANSYFVGRRERTVPEALGDSLSVTAAASLVGVPAAYLVMRHVIPALASTDATVLAWSAMIFVPTSANLNLSGILIGTDRVRQLAVRQLIVAVLAFSTLTALFATGRLTVAAAVLLNLAAGVLTTALYLGVLRPGRGALFVAVPSWERIRRQASFAGRAYVANLAAYMDKRQDIVLLGMLSTSEAAGVYSVGVVFAELLWQVPKALAPALMARSLAADEPSRRTGAATATRITFALMGVTLLVLLAVLGPLISYAYGPAFTRSFSVFVALAPGVLVYGLAMVAMNYLTARGILLPKVAAFVTLLNLALNVVLIPRFASLGAAASSTVSYTLGGALILWRFKSVSGLPLKLILWPRADDARTVVRALKAMLGARERNG